MADSIPLVYSHAHNQHHPEVEFVDSKLFPYPEVPDRINRVLSYFENKDIVKLVTSEATTPIEAIKQTHSPELVDFLVRGYENTSKFYPEPPAYVYPYVFPAHPSMSRLKENEFGKIGAFCFDTESPLGKHTWRAVEASAATASAATDMLLAGKKAVYSLN